MPTPTTLATGLAGAIGSDYRRNHAQLVFVEYGGKLSRLNLFRPAVVLKQGTIVLKGTFTFNLDTGVEGNPIATADIQWVQQTALIRNMAPLNAARIVNLGVVDFASLSPDSLQHLTYGTTPIVGNNDASNKLVNGDVFAVITNGGNYAKVKVDVYGYNLTIDWVTYQITSGYAVLGTGYANPEDVKVSVDDAHAYVTERTGDLVKVLLTSANRAAATVVTAGMNSPQQLFLDEAHNQAFVIEYANPGHLWRINLTSGAKTAIVSNIEFGVGLTLSSDLQNAYITEQTTGPAQGRLSSIQISSGARTVIATGLTAPFFLTWENDAQTSLLVPERDPANRITSVAVPGGASHVAVAGVPFRPSSVTVPTPGEMLICSDTVIEEIDFDSGVFQPGGPLLMGIGFIPYTKVLGTGLADTTSDPTYFYQRKNVPFGGTLPIMVNHQRAANDGCVWYRVKVDGVVHMDSWADEKWNGTTYVPVTTAPSTVAGQPGYYPVHLLSELFLWMNPSLGCLLDSTGLNNGLHTILLEFVSGAGALVETSTPLTIMVNNQSCAGALAMPTLNGATADPICGLLHYVIKNNDPVIMGFTASHPAGYATFSFSLYKGTSSVALTAAPPTSGPVSAAVSPLSQTVANLMGTCNVAGFAEYLYVAATIDNGWGRQSQYDASAAVAFVLGPPGI
jgi:hypothetical protein